MAARVATDGSYPKIWRRMDVPTGAASPLPLNCPIGDASPTRAVPLVPDQLCHQWSLAPRSHDAQAARPHRRFRMLA
jgi:hypothetical protein